MEVNKFLKRLEKKLDGTSGYKNLLKEQYISYTLMKILHIFKYENLPDEIPEEVFETFLQTSGHCIFTKYYGKYYVFIGTYGGELDAYYKPKNYIVSNPWINLTKTYNIGKDCVICKNDYYSLGLLPIIEKYAKLLSESDITMEINLIWSRLQAVFIGKSERALDSLKEAVEQIYNGNLSVITDSYAQDNVRVETIGTAANQSLTNLIEVHQYLKASLLNELGINANFNMKREALNSAESALNEDGLEVLIDSMLKERKRFVEDINKMYDLNIKVDYSEEWKKSENLNIEGGESDGTQDDYGNE